MFQPQNLPGRYGRVVKAIDHLLEVIQGQAVLGGGWAVWHHGFIGRITQGIDIALPAAIVEEFLQTGSVSGFEILPRQVGTWPKMLHKETGIQVDILPEGGRPGSASKPAPTTIPHPEKMGAAGSTLRYMSLSALVELKIAAGRLRDESDVGELIRANLNQVDAIRKHLAQVHHDYVQAFDHLVQRARQQDDR